MGWQVEGLPMEESKGVWLQVYVPRAEEAWEVNDFLFPTQISHTRLISSGND